MSKMKRVSVDVDETNHKKVQRAAVDTQVKPKQYYEKVIADHFKKRK